MCQDIGDLVSPSEWIGRPWWNCPGCLGARTPGTVGRTWAELTRTAAATAGARAKDTLRPWRDRLVHRLGGTMPAARADLRAAGAPALPPPARRPARRGRRGRDRGPDQRLDDPAHARVDRAPAGADRLLGAADQRGRRALHRRRSGAAVRRGRCGGHSRPALGHVRAAPHRGLRAALPPGHDRRRRRRQPRLLLAAGVAAGRAERPGHRARAELGELPAPVVVAPLERHHPTSSLLPVAADEAPGWAYYSTHVGSNGGLIDDGDLLSRFGVGGPDVPARRPRRRDRSGS